LHDNAGNAFCHRNHFIYSYSSFVSVCAFFASDGFIKLGLCDPVRLEADLLEGLLRYIDRLFAMAAKPPGQSLGDYKTDGGGDIKRRNSHVPQAGEGFWRAVGMKRRKHHMPGLRCLDCNLCRLEV